MPPSPIRKVERETASSAGDPARPRDAALRAAAKRRRGDIVTPPRTPDAAYPTIDQSFTTTYQTSGTGESILNEAASRPVGSTTTRAAGQVTRRPGKSAAITSNRASRSGKQLKNLHNPKKALTQKLPGSLGGLADRVIATEVSISILSWGTTVWLSFQIPFALLAIVCFALAGAWESAKDSLGWLGTAVSWLASKALEGIKTLTGFDLSVFDPTNFFIIANTVTMFIGWGTMLGIGLSFMLAGVPCLSGKGVVIKYATFILALVGYAVPFLNLFPWAIFWVIAVWYYPTD